ncbi:RICIN domain-containing protein [Bacillus mycoides]|uniref:RICIN domain-containing protein n=1 Tax=Bacillus mycoides TaxID=1405 RepID=UPI003D6617E5
MINFNFPNNQYCVIANKQDLNYVVDLFPPYIIDGLHLESLIIDTRDNEDSQQFILFKLDGEMLAIANKANGKAAKLLVTSSAIKTNNNAVVQSSWAGEDSQIWYIPKGPDQGYRIINKQYGLNLEARVDSNGQVENDFLRAYSPRNTKTQQWNFDPVETIQLPAVIETEPLPGIPKYTSSPDEVLPAQTNPVITATSLLPCIMVSDNQWTDQTKIYLSPYYTFVKEQYWERVESFTFPPGYSKTFRYTTGINITDQDSMNKTTGMSIGMDAGFQFKGISTSISTNFTNQLEVTKSHTTEQMTEQEVTETYTNPFQTTVGWTKYILINKYYVLRTDGSLVTSPWKVSDPNTTRITTYPTVGKLESTPILN